MIFRCYKFASGGFAVVAMVAVLSLLLANSFQVLTSVPFYKFVSGIWGPSSGEFNLLPLAFSGLAASGLAMLVVAPVSFLSALALQIFIPQLLGRIFRKIFEMMSGIPSVIFGLWGLGVIVPIVGEWVAPGASLLAASLVLSIMVLPSTILLFSQAIHEVPGEQIAAAKALSLSLGGQIRHVIFPYAFHRMASVLCLQFARTLGETMAVVMVAGNIPSWPTSIFDPIRTLTGHIALEIPYAEGDHRSALMLSGLLLCLPSWGLFYVARRHLQSRRLT